MEKEGGRLYEKTDFKSVFLFFQFAKTFILMDRGVLVPFFAFTYSCAFLI